MYGIIMKAREAVKMRHISTINDQSKASTLRRSRLRNRIRILAEQVRCPCCVATQEDDISRQSNQLQDGQTRNCGDTKSRLQNFQASRIRTQLPRHHNSTITVPLTL